MQKKFILENSVEFQENRVKINDYQIDYDLLTKIFLKTMENIGSIKGYGLSMSSFNQSFYSNIKGEQKREEKKQNNIAFDVNFLKIRPEYQKIMDTSSTFYINVDNNNHLLIKDKELHEKPLIILDIKRDEILKQLQDDENKNKPLLIEDINDGKKRRRRSRRSKKKKSKRRRSKKRKFRC